MTCKINLKSPDFYLILFIFIVGRSYSQISEAILTSQHSNIFLKNEKLSIRVCNLLVSDFFSIFKHLNYNEVFFIINSYNLYYVK